MKISRRRLIEVSAGALPATLLSCTRDSYQSVTSLRPAGLSWAELRAFYERELAGELGFWRSNGIDPVHGGFMCSMDQDGTLLSTEKNLMLQGRGLWVYSFLYSHFGRRAEDLETARKVKDFLMRHGRQAGGRWPEVLTREGEVMAPFRGSLYPGLYVAEGLQEYSRATDDSEAMDEALRTIRQCMEDYDRPDFGKGLQQASPFGSREQAIEMVITHLLARLLHATSDSQLHKLQERTIEAIFDRFFHPEFRLNNEVLDHDYHRYAEPIWEEFVHLGFSIANFWGIMTECMRRKDQIHFREAAERLRRHLEVAWDDVYGGLGWTMQVGEGCIDYRKVSYIHQEAMYALLLVIERLEAPWAVDWFNQIHSFAFERFPISGQTGWYTYLDRLCTPPLQVNRRENYHFPRFLMLGLLAIDRILGRSKVLPHE